MKLLLAVALLIATPAAADPIDDYAACMIGHAAVALQKQPDGKKDSEAAQTVAYALCKEPEDIGESEAEGLSDFVNLAVEAISSGIWNGQ